MKLKPTYHELEEENKRLKERLNILAPMAYRSQIYDVHITITGMNVSLLGEFDPRDLSGHIADELAITFTRIVDKYAKKNEDFVLDNWEEVDVKMDKVFP